MISVQKVIFPGIALGCFFLVIITNWISSPGRSLVALAQPLPEPTQALTVAAVLEESAEPVFMPAVVDSTATIQVAEQVQEILATPPAPTEEVHVQENIEEEQPEECPLSSGYPDTIRQWCDLIQRYAGEHGVDPNLVAAVMLQESGGNAEAYSKSGAVGLMQVMPRDGLAAGFMCVNGPCFAARPSMEELFDPEFNINYGVRMLAGLTQRYGDVREALRAYGPMNYGYRYADIILNIVANHQ